MRNPIIAMALCAASCWSADMIPIHGADAAIYALEAADAAETQARLEANAKRAALAAVIGAAIDDYCVSLCLSIRRPTPLESGPINGFVGRIDKIAKSVESRRKMSLRTDGYYEKYAVHIQGFFEINDIMWSAYEAHSGKKRPIIASLSKESRMRLGKVLGMSIR